MKPLISKSTYAFLQSFEGKVEEEAANYISSKDEIDQIISNGNLAIHNLFFDKAIDIMLIVLSNGKILKRKISDFSILNNATEAQLANFKIEWLGIHWIDLDYDLSLKGFLEYELIFIDKPFSR
ncbi:MAG: DUF2442 domain-containing protein [Bacteroidetes bacterium]|nr:DUF2442 domain-containing protein [Bacteroidota bacterium]